MFRVLLLRAAPRPALRSVSASRAARDREVDAAQMKLQLVAQRRSLPDLDSLVFGRVFTDHMLTMRWDKVSGWDAPVIEAVRPFSIHPAASCLHYAIECFDGLKAYKTADNKPVLFRPIENMRRLRRSCERLMLPSFDEEEMLLCLKKLIAVENQWIPQRRGFSLYIRPTCIGVNAALGVAAPDEALMYMLLSPVGPYYKSGFKAVSLLAEEHYARAWPGGSGCDKVGSNYAPTILPADIAMRSGYTQVLWLGPRQNVTEVGTMNMFVYWINEHGERELVTAPLDGTILPGVTRDSILELARTWKEFRVSEREFTIHEVLKAVQDGRMLEAFGSGTAAIVSPVKTISYGGQDFSIPLNPMQPDSQMGPLTQRFLQSIQRVQYGEETFRDWCVSVDVNALQ